MKNLTRIIILLFVLGSCLASIASAQVMSKYSYKPPVISEASKPNTMILVSNDQTGFTHGYRSVSVYDDDDDYYGYFDFNKYYEYSQKQFHPVGYVVSGTHYVPVSAGNSYWSGNFLNWAASASADFLRKALAGGTRGDDNIGTTSLVRATIPSGNVWKVSYSGSDFNRLVPAIYANPLYEFYNSNRTMAVRNSSNGNTIVTFNIDVQVCVWGMLEDNCFVYTKHANNAKPQGLLHIYREKMDFGLMTYSHDRTQSGGVVRKNIGYIDGEWNEDSGLEIQQNNESMVRYINQYSQKGWDPLAEMYYDAIRYFKGNKAGSKAYCGAIKQSDDNFKVVGCQDNAGSWWIDPVKDWCEKNNIIIFNDEYPSREHDELPGTSFFPHAPWPAYTVEPNFSGGNDYPYDINVADLTDEVGNWEASNGTTSNDWYVGNILGGLTNGSCALPKTVTALSSAYGICPTEPTGDPYRVNGSGDLDPSGALGNFYLAGIAHHAYTHDLRPGIKDFQNVRTWAVAFQGTPNAVYNAPEPPMNQMWLAAKYGNFDDLNENGKPDTGEWEDPDRVDKNGKPLPNGYYPASDGSKMVDAIQNIFDKILETTASSTAVSVLSNSGQGEGNLVQAYYRPRMSIGNESVDWVGFVQSLWIDEFGYIREDTTNDNVLVKTQDYVVRYVEGSGSAAAQIFAVDANNPYPDFENDTPDEVPLEEVKVLWDAGRVLSITDPADRNIFTYINKDGPSSANPTGKQYVEERMDDSGNVNTTTSESAMFDSDGEVIRFYDRNYRALMPYLNVNGANDGYLGRSQKIRALNLVRWTQGYDPEKNKNKYVDRSNVDARNRAMTLTDGTEVVYKLGDVINSTPVTISAPPDNYHIIYSDETYQDYYNANKDRETVVYVGANDGMLHAFTAWEFKKSTTSFVNPDTSSGIPIGGELWAYIPQNLLPHLKWLPRQDYSHVYYVDMQPRVFDARVFLDANGQPINPTENPNKHPKGWGTILVGAYGIGGGDIFVTDTFDDGTGATGPNYVANTQRFFRPSYFAIDITDPRNPELLWDRTFEGLGMSYSYPTIVRADSPTSLNHDGGIWTLVFGSGPDDGSQGMGVPQYDGESNRTAKFYAVDVLTGEPYQGVDAASITRDYLFETETTDGAGNDVSNAFAGPPVSFDRNLNYNVDAIYMPITIDAGTPDGTHDWKGAIYKATVPWNGALSTSTDKVQYGNLSSGKYSEIPNDTTNPLQKEWLWHKLFDASRPITAAPALSIDQLNNTWVYFGSGRMFEAGDDANSDFGSQQIEYLYGIKDPFFNRDYNTAPIYYFDYSNFLTLTDDPANVPPDLFPADDYAVLTTGQVYKYDGTSYSLDPNFDYFDQMVLHARANFDGWRRALRHIEETDPDDGSTKIRPMRSLNKPSVIGGLSLFSTFMPTGATCSFGGESDLNILYYETGTAYKRSVATGAFAITEVDVNSDGNMEQKVNESISLGAGTTSSVGIHIGRQNSKAAADGDDPEGDMVTGFVQQGTGKVVEINIETALKVRSGLRSWRER